MKHIYLILSLFFALFTAGMIFGILVDEQIIEGWSIFHAFVLLVIILIIVGPILLYKNQLSLKSFVLLLGCIYLTLACILSGIEYSASQIRGFGSMGYTFPIILGIFGIWGVFLS